MANKPIQINGASRKPSDVKGLWRKNTPSDTNNYWSAISPEVIRGAIDAVTRSGGAVMFGITADGGAYSLCVLQGNEKLKDYPHDPADCEQRLKDLIEWYVDFQL